MKKTIICLFLLISLFSMITVSYATETDYSYLEDMTVKELKELRNAIDLILGDDVPVDEISRDYEETDVFGQFSTSMTQEEIHRMFGIEDADTPNHEHIENNPVQFCGLEGNYYITYRDDKDKTVGYICWDAVTDIDENYFGKYLTDYKEETNRIIDYYSKMYGEPEKTNLLESYPIRTHIYDSYSEYEWEDNYYNQIVLTLTQTSDGCDIYLVLQNNYLFRESVEDSIKETPTTVEEAVDDDVTDAVEDDAKDATEAVEGDVKEAIEDVEEVKDAVEAVDEAKEEASEAVDAVEAVEEVKEAVEDVEGAKEEAVEAIDDTVSTTP